MRVPEDTPLEISAGAWNLFGDLDALASGDRMPLDPHGMELLRRHRAAAQSYPGTEMHSQFRFARAGGRMFVVLLRTTWWPDNRESGLGFLGPTARFLPTTATGPGLLTLMCLDNEWETLVGERPDVKPWPRDN